MKQRNFGLDIVRAGAILLVLINHSINYFASFPLSQPIGDMCGIYGVEIFFVLSGFLIGQIYFRDVLPNLSRKSIKTFYIRRWMRTLPLYYMMLILFIFINMLRTKTLTMYPFHFVFLQNLVPHGLDFFSVSWSLAIEEWFYLLLPFLALLSYRKNSTPQQQIQVLFVSILIILGIRLFVLSVVNMPYEGVRRVIPLRFDSLLIGVLLSGIKLHMQQIYEELRKPAHVAAIAVVLGFALYTQYIYYTRHELDTSHFAKIFSLPLMSILLVSLLPFMETNPLLNISLPNISIMKSFFTWISLLSYSTYLVHLEIFDLTRVYLRNRFPLMAIMPIALCITFCLSYFLYTYLEKPIMDMRKNFR